MAELDVAIVAVERKIWSGKATFLFTRTTSGEIGILPNHIPLVAQLVDDAMVRVEREGEDGDGRPIRRWVGPRMPGGDPEPFRVRDLEKGALRRANAIAKAHGMTIYHQGDPRGCSLYLIRPGDVPDGQCVTGYYTRGIAICIE